MSASGWPRKGVQIHGGMGFIEETGAAQHYRDARIAPIYEGANGIQAIDLVGRKLMLGEGQAVGDLMDDIRDTIEILLAGDLKAVGLRLEAALNAAASATAWLIERRTKSMPDALSGATAYQKLLGDVVGGWMLAKGALAADGEADTAWAESKRAWRGCSPSRCWPRFPGAAAGVMLGAGLGGDDARSAGRVEDLRPEPSDAVVRQQQRRRPVRVEQHTSRVQPSDHDGRTWRDAGRSTADLDRPPRDRADPGMGQRAGQTERVVKWAIGPDQGAGQHRRPAPSPYRWRDIKDAYFGGPRTAAAGACRCGARA
jgi:hypothetical protein